MSRVVLPSPATRDAYDAKTTWRPLGLTLPDGGPGEERESVVESDGVQSETD